MMKAGIYQGKQGVQLTEKEIPPYGAKDVLIRNLRAGICGTDINIVRFGAEHQGIEIGSEFGHEMVGRVVATGEEVTPDIKVGMIVGVNPITAKKVGRRLSLQCSGFSQYNVVEDAQLNYNLYAFDADISLEAAVLMEPMSVGRHGAFQTKPQPEDHIVVLGAGTIGLSAAANLIGEGIRNICVVDNNARRLEKAKALGAYAINTAEQSMAESLADYFGAVNVYGQTVPDVDVFIDAAGAPALITQVMDIVKPKARVSIIAVYKQPISFAISQIMSKEVQMVGASGYTNEDILKVVEHLNEQKTNISSIVTDIYKLEKISEAFDTAIHSSEAIKVVVDLS